MHVARIRAHDQAKINTIRGTRDFICTTGKPWSEHVGQGHRKSMFNHAHCTLIWGAFSYHLPHLLGPLRLSPRSDGVLADAGMDHKVKLLDWQSGAEVRVLQSHTSSVWGLDVDEAVNPHMLVSSGYCVASLTDLRSAAPPVTLRAHATWIRSLQVDLSRYAA